MLKTQTHKVLMLRRSGTPSNDANRDLKNQADGKHDCSSRQPCRRCRSEGAADVATQRSVTPSDDANRSVKSQADGDDDCSS